MAKTRRSTTKHTDDEDSSESWDREEGSNFDPEEGSNWDSTEQSQTSNETPEKKPVIGAAENRRVIYSRILVAVVLAVSAAATAFGAYWLTAKEETNNFERDVSAFALLLIDFDCSTLDCLLTILNFHDMFSLQALRRRLLKSPKRLKTTWSRSWRTTVP